MVVIYRHPVLGLWRMYLRKRSEVTFMESRQRLCFARDKSILKEVDEISFRQCVMAGSMRSLMKVSLADIAAVSSVTVMLPE
jgi:hypothetical protein